MEIDKEIKFSLEMIEKNVNYNVTAKVLRNHIEELTRDKKTFKEGIIALTKITVPEKQHIQLKKDVKAKIKELIDCGELTISRAGRTQINRVLK